MNKEIKEKWLQALRSGEYKQGKGSLRKLDDTFCCLGVLCDIVHGRGHWVKPDGNDTAYHSLSGFAGLPSIETTDLCGIPERVGLRHTGLKLASMNDTDKRSFAEIADWIEENL